MTTVDSNYARWRLAQILGVTEAHTYPVLFQYRFPGSKASSLSTRLPTSDPMQLMVNVLVDAKTNFGIDEVFMNKNSVVIEPNGSRTNIAKLSPSPNSNFSWGLRWL